MGCLLWICHSHISVFIIIIVIFDHVISTLTLLLCSLSHTISIWLFYAWFYFVYCLSSSWIAVNFPHYSTRWQMNAILILPDKLPLVCYTFQLYYYEILLMACIQYTSVYSVCKLLCELFQGWPSSVTQEHIHCGCYWLSLCENIAQCDSYIGCTFLDRNRATLRQWYDKYM